MKHIRCTTSWLLYWIGDAFFKLQLYRPYNWCMLKSSDLDTGDCGIWIDAPPVESNARQS